MPAPPPPLLFHEGEGRCVRPFATLARKLFEPAWRIEQLMKVDRAWWWTGVGLSLLMVQTTGHAAALEKKTVATAGVTRIEFATPGELVVKRGAEEKLVIEAEPKVLAALDPAVKGDTLELRSKGSFKTEKNLKYLLTVKAFRSLKTTGSGNSEVEGFEGKEMDVTAAGSGNIELKGLIAERMGLTIANSGDISAKGRAKSLSARIDGAGTLDAASVPAKTVEAKLAGSGTIRVHAEETLKATLSGAGSIEYKGNPKLTQSISGAGSIDRL